MSVVIVMVTSIDERQNDVNRQFVVFIDVNLLDASDMTNFMKALDKVFHL